MKRAPNGYRIIRWSDGFYHVYFGGECLDGVLTRKEALQIAIKAKQVIHDIQLDSYVGLTSEDLY